MKIENQETRYLRANYLPSCLLFERVDIQDIVDIINNNDIEIVNFYERDLKAYQQTLFETFQKGCFKVEYTTRDIERLQKEFLFFKNKSEINKYKVSIISFDEYIKNLNKQVNYNIYQELENHFFNLNYKQFDILLQYVIVQVEVLRNDSKHNIIYCNKSCLNVIEQLININCCKWYKPKEDRLLREIKETQYTLSDESYLKSIELNNFSDKSSVIENTQIEDFLIEDTLNSFKFKDYTNTINYLNSIYEKKETQKETRESFYLNDYLLFTQYFNKNFNLLDNKLSLIERVQIAQKESLNDVFWNIKFYERQQTKNRLYVLLKNKTKARNKFKRVARKRKAYKIDRKFYLQKQDTKAREIQTLFELLENTQTSLIKKERSKIIKKRKELKRKQYLKNNKFLL